MTRSNSTNPEIGRSVQAGSIRTNYHDHGSGDPLIMIHGSGPGVSAWANWRFNIPALARRRRVLAPDMVGFGYSERPENCLYGKDLWIDHLCAFMDALGIERADLLGNSFGGGLALAFAIRFPNRVQRLVLMGSVGLTFPLTDALDLVWGYTPSLEAMRELFDLFAHDRTLVTDELVQLRYEASIRPGFEDFSRMFPKPRQQCIDALACDEAAISSLEHQTLLIHGREDRVIPFELSVRLFKLIRRAQLHIYGNCGHWTQIEHRDSFNRLVESFLGAADGSEGPGMRRPRLT